MKQKILFVDDEQDVLKGLSRILQDQKGEWDMTFLTNAEDALQSCLANEYDVIVSDISMPGKTGFELLRGLQSFDKTKNIPVVILTGFEDRKLKKQALQLGAADLLNKQAPREDLLDRLQSCLRLKAHLDEIQGHKKTLEQRVQERTIELEETRFQVIRRLGRAAEFKDNETGMHVIRMSKYSAILGIKIGLGSKECNLLLNAAPMHDIGKIGIPDSVLLKPGKLNPDEWEIMKTHVDIGAEILSGDDSELIKMARIITLQHHERWDGKGYPFGLKSTDISIEGRIVALCDVFDALTSDRPYKRAWSVENAIEFIVEQKGNSFDPSLVDNFIEILSSILKIKKNYSDDRRIKNKTIQMCGFDS